MTREQGCLAHLTFSSLPGAKHYQKTGTAERMNMNAHSPNRWVLANGVSSKPKEQQQLSYEDIESSANHVLEQTKHRPKIGIICGSGLSGIGDHVTDADVLQYKSIPNFPVSTVEGHKGQMTIGLLHNVPVVCLQGRCHMFEGNPAWKCSTSVRILKLMGVKCLIITNAAGSTNKAYKPGDVVIIRDHVNLPGMTVQNPLIGNNDAKFGPRFPDMSNAYDKNLRKLALKVSRQIGLDSIVHKRAGIYGCLSGPNYETPAEIRFAVRLGMDLLGMSTCPEVVAARHCGIKVLAFSLVTNSCDPGDESESETEEAPQGNHVGDDYNIHNDVVSIGASRGEHLAKLIKQLLPTINAMK